VSKPIWASKTFWFNILAVLIGVAGQFGFGEFVADDWTAQAIIVAVAVINIILRFWTTQAVRLT